MPLTVTELYDAALTLSKPERVALADLIHESVAPGIAPKPAWVDELRRRAAEIDSGAVRPVPWEEVREQIKKQLRGEDAARG